MDYGKVLIDGDILAYRAAFATQEDHWKMSEIKVRELLEYVLYECVSFPEPSDYEVYLTGQGNFRYEIAKTYEYKANRKGATKPKNLPLTRQWLIDNHNAIVSEGEEADDLIAKEVAKLSPDCVVASIDKDMLQLPCWHFNFSTGEWRHVTEWEGLKFFYSQILTGDRADNIVGLWKVGPVKASKILKDANTERELWDACLKAYDNDHDRVLENARLLWLRREEGELFVPPTAQD